MEHYASVGPMDAPTAYDYRLYDRIWQRVSPDMDPYPDICSAAPTGSTPAAAPPAAAEPAAAPTGAAAPVTGASAAAPTAAPAAPTASGSRMGENLENLPGAEADPCCMGSEAQESLEVLVGFIEEELSGCRCCLALARKTCNACACRLLRRIAAEKGETVRRLRAAYFLITGTCYIPASVVERVSWSGLPAALRAVYHQEVCNGFNYERAGEETPDLCLQRMLEELGARSYARAEELLDLLGRILC